MVDVNGVLIIDKPAGMTSHDIVARVRKITGERRVGHTGTLDPFATGVLVVPTGRATRLAQFLSGADKEYEAVIRFGFATDTGDTTGTRLDLESHAKAQSAQSIRKENIEAAMAALRGEIEQTPPMYSAKKVGGRKLYELARRGEEIERKPLRVTVSEFEAMPRGESSLKENQDGTQDLNVRVVCSAGTYVRTLAEDFGKSLGVGAHLTELRRTRAGRFRIDDAITLERLTELSETTSIDSVLISPNDAVSDLPMVQLSREEAACTRHGIDLRIEETVSANWENDQAVRMTDLAGDLIAVGRYVQSEGTIHPGVVIAE
jgi:tRNA pseudouridine55 synthase